MGKDDAMMGGEIDERMAITVWQWSVARGQAKELDRADRVTDTARIIQLNRSNTQKRGCWLSLPQQCRKSATCAAAEQKQNENQTLISCFALQAREQGSEQRTRRHTHMQRASDTGTKAQSAHALYAGSGLFGLSTFDRRGRSIHKAV